MTTVTRLQVAPVKGLAVVPQERIALGPDGVAEDRRLFLLQPDGAVATLRRHSGLARCVPDLDLEAGRLTVTTPDGAAVTSELAAAAEPCAARLFGKDRAGHVLPGAVADALSELAGEPLRVVLAAGPGVGWDEGPVSLVARASATAAGVPAGSAAQRLRMLIEVDGPDAYAEDGWAGRPVRVGDAVVRVTHPLARCVVIEHSPSSGAKDWAGLRTLAERRGRDRLTLGVIARVEQPGTIRVGDPVEVD